ncbi:MAG TPA: AAA family ATPase [Gaiellaceae bacterium]|jgi:pilus assembly protein CpaE
MSAVTQSAPVPGLRSRTPVCVIGSSETMPELLDALRNRDDVEVVHASTFLADATDTLESGGVEAVLYVTHAGPGWLDEVASIREHTSAPVVLLSSNESGAVLDQALDAGVAEALLLPQVVENVAFALRRARRSREDEGSVVGAALGNVTTVFSPKGGIGKTVIASNLASMLAGEAKRRTLLVDLDLQFGDTAIVLGLHPEQTMHDLFSAPGGLDPQKLAGYATRHESGLDVLPAPLRPQDADLVSDAKLARLFEVARGSYDEIVVDTAPFLHGSILTALDYTDDLVLICSAEVPALKDVRLSLNTLQLLAFPEEKIRLVLNHAHGDGGLKRSDVEDALGLKATALVPNDRDVSKAINRGVPASQLDPKSEFAGAIRGLTQTLHPHAVSAPAPEAGLGRLLKRSWR